jgi:hypothetical protein
MFQTYQGSHRLTIGIAHAHGLKVMNGTCRHQFRAATNHEQVAALIDLRDLSQLDAKLQSCKAARPGMKVSGKRTALSWTGLVTGRWSEELADDRC